ncbi:Hypothetical protein PHPALM_202 [Phytophthora palmivora]|uniref:Peptidase A2 domain-containing protein n=1 Tax=Phytophthora palmivora TaxID=4796 RepID=A0A2P4YVE5_9STRA|nr:Hypothetical protein PHPALM_202 [Phytophthora palmivora]
MVRMGSEKKADQEEDDGIAVAHIDALTVQASLLDSGADDSLASVGVRDTMRMYPVGGGMLVVSRKIRFDEVTLETPAGPLMLRGLVCWINEGDKSLALTISRLVMKRLGYETPKLLAASKARSDEYQLDDMDTPAAADRNFTCMHALMRDKTQDYFQPNEIDELVTTPSLPSAPDHEGV